MTYLPFWIHFSFVSALFFAYLFSWLGFFLILLIYVGTLIIFRKKRSHYNFKETPSITTRGLVFSPVSGKLRFNFEKETDVFGEKQKVRVLGVTLPWWREAGIYLPMTGEIETFSRSAGKGWFRFLKLKSLQKLQDEFSGCKTSIQGVEGQKVALDFVKCPLGMSPKVWSMPGDRGRRKAPMGFFPFGGTVLIYLPENYKILPNIGETLNSGESVLAADPDREMS